MATLNLNNEKKQIVFGDDSIVIQKWISGIKGGRTLDATGFTGVIKAGHVIITDGKGVYKPMPVSGEAYAELPGGYTYAGISTLSTFTGVLPFACVKAPQTQACLPYFSASRMQWSVK